MNLVVSHGLRSRELSHREKARKALLKIMQDLTPSYLFLVCDVMKSLLIKGFQTHVYLFTMHNLMQNLVDSGRMATIKIPTRVVELNMDVLLSELFGDLNAEKSNDQGNQQHLIKEAKSRKA